ncbi:short chain dehydrogenase domain-containing protein [Ditylenchus destructor]|nr:short chain dehydrogenase domain-containing protein [Ditylenchus destructor]
MWPFIWDWCIWLLKAYVAFRIMKALHIVVLSIYGHFFCKELDLEPYKASWTVVTGCTDGIGRAYVLELARKRGLRKFYLIGRNQTKLDSIAGELAEKHSCTVRTTKFDFESHSYEKLPAELSELPVGILINCAGIAPERVANFAELPEGLPSKILRVNLMSAVKMIELILPGMLKRDLGIVVTVSSITGWRPLPYLSTYPASKAALSFFSDSLADEFSTTNVKFQCLIPFLVATKIASYESEGADNILVVDPTTYARQAVHVIGQWRISTGCFLHDIQIAFGVLVGFSLFKTIFVPFGLLGIHKKRVDTYRSKIESSVTNEKPD